LKRLYPEPGSKVTYVRNITDVDDKINAAAKETGEDIRSITTRTTKAFHDDMAALGALDPDFEPRATDHIEEMKALVAKLIEGGHAYEAEGHVLFSVPTMADYGRLSNLDRDELVAGARVEVAPYKRDPADFVLWKPSDDPDLPAWDSPWGRGRPGWHLECSAMSAKILGPEFDLHGGGQDLIFPHHENEIAQSTCMVENGGGSGGDGGFAKYWMHNGYLMAEGEKMSKSLGNFYTVHELLDEFGRVQGGEAIRLALLKTHYRQPLDFTKAGIAEAKRELDGFYGALRRTADVPPVESEVNPDVEDALKDDLNTPLALHHLHNHLAILNTIIDRGGSKKSRHEEIAGTKGVLLAAADLLGLLNADPEDWFKGAAVEGGLDDAAIDALIAERTQARADKDFARADEIRDELADARVLLEDGARGTTWKRA